MTMEHFFMNVCLFQITFKSYLFLKWSIIMNPLFEPQRTEVLPKKATRWPFGPRLRGALVFLFQLSIKYYATGY